MIYEYDKNNPTKYRVSFTIKAPLRNDVSVTQTMSQEDLDKAIGRWTRKHGPPVNMSKGGSSVVLLNFYNKLHNGVWEIDLSYESETKVSTVPMGNKEETPPAPPEIQPEQIQALLNMEVITKTNKWGY